ncbi:phytoene desaturase family protein [Euzebya tangerina]|uniref:phytoene desaturase family protein n=1 Tax=Euzebya tangerina TaxID=591198 RepID=UPI0013C2FA35|nr:NAD(P)/FAD-dependent oxidoreductase [Euzebya tangerina]
MPPTAVIVGAGHNGLVAACYLAKAGVQVTVLEQSHKPGGGSRTDETVPGYRFDTHSAAHNIINMTDILAELELSALGLEYVEMDPFAVSITEQGETIRFWRDVDKTVESIRAVAPEDADGYRRFVEDSWPIVELAVTGVNAGASWRRELAMVPDRVRPIGQALAKHGVFGLVELMSMPYGAMLRRYLSTDAVLAPIGAFAAHGNASPIDFGTAFSAIWQAVYHRHGQWHAVGGAQGLTDALVARLESLGGTVRCDALVDRILTRDGTVQGVELADGERVPAHVVVTAIDPRVALLDLLDPPLGGKHGADLRSTHHGNAVQMVVHVATDRLPQYRSAEPADFTGLQSYVDTFASLERAFAAAQDRRLPEGPVPTYAFTTSALDDTLAPEGHHTVYLACPAAPAEVRGGWAVHQEEFADRMIETVEARAPGFRETIQGISIRTPELMEAELRWAGAHPMYLDLSLDQLVSARPTVGLGDHSTPVRGLFISGAGTAPVGGVAGTPGRAAAKAVLKRHGRPRN